MSDDAVIYTVFEPANYNVIYAVKKSLKKFVFIFIGNQHCNLVYMEIKKKKQQTHNCKLIFCFLKKNKKNETTLVNHCFVTHVKDKTENGNFDYASPKPKLYVKICVE